MDFMLKFFNPLTVITVIFRVEKVSYSNEKVNQLIFNHYLTIDIKQYLNSNV